MLTAPLLGALGVAHAFGTRSEVEPDDWLCARQVHGARVVEASACRAQPPPEADAVVSAEPGVFIGVVTADCVPILLAAGRGAAVAAVHAGWRGLAAGVIEAGVAALQERARGEALSAVVGPHIGPCCYEVDAPVLDALAARQGSLLDACLCNAGSRHAQLDLGALTLAVLEREGVGRRGSLTAGCTACEARRFHSYRRDGARAGRLVHRIAAAPAPSAPRSS